MERVWIYYSILIEIYAVHTFGIGLWGLIIKRPLVLANRQYMWFVLPVILPIINLSLHMLGEISRHDSLFSLSMAAIYHMVVVALGILILWYSLSGYMIVGITDETFREALVNALNKLNFSYQENVSKVKLTSLDADLKANVSSTTGTAQFRIRQWRHVRYTKVIANEMDDYFKSNTIKVNNLAYILYLLIGGLMVVGVVFAIFSGITFGF